jgi:hypothetical protein
MQSNCSKNNTNLSSRAREATGEANVINSKEIGFYNVYKAVDIID